jgi:tetratricopeptide (TPR) repeat protein
VYGARGDATRAVEAYREYTDRNVDDLEAHLEFAALQRRLGDGAGERGTLARTLWIEPFALEPHRRLAEAYETAGDWPRAVLERRALLAHEPTDRAAAWYDLARAQHGAGDTGAARRSVLQALEIAPSYEEALELLLTIREGEE